VVEFEKEVMSFGKIERKEDFDFIVELRVFVVVGDGCEVGVGEEVRIDDALSKALVQVEYRLVFELVKVSKT
jgi:hypothetical protein